MCTIRLYRARGRPRRRPEKWCLTELVAASARAWTVARAHDKQSETREQAVDRSAGGQRAAAAVTQDFGVAAVPRGRRGMGPAVPEYILNI